MNKYNQVFLNEKMDEAPDKSYFFPTCVKFFGQKLKFTKITALKSQKRAILKLQTPSNKRENPRMTWKTKLLTYLCC